MSIGTMQITGFFIILATLGTLIYSGYLLYTHSSSPNQPVNSGKSRQRGKKH